MLELLFLLLPVAAGYGWIMGRNSVRQAQRKQSSILSKHYYKGLNFLLSDQPDKAVDTLIKMINVNSDTVETHIAMGSFFRHRGEIDRAIKVHQNLVSRDELQPAQRENALRELGHDYTQAGFLERAENAFLQLLNSEKHYLVAQQQLFSIYQTTKEWERAIELAERMVQCHGDNDDVCERLAHFYCEQAAVELKNESQGAALTLLQKAVNADEHAVRPWLMLGDIALEQKRFTDANAYFTQVAERDINWFSEAVPSLEKIAEETDDWESFQKNLEAHWQECATSYLAMVDVLMKRGETAQAAEYLLEQLRKRPTMRGFKTLMGLYIDQLTDQTTADSLRLLKELVEKQMLQRPKYRCGSCGFSGRKLYWLCPSCKKWGVVKPIKGLDGE
ncbi:lipopolysaccharide assembly protein LapB [Alteromonas mediterranea]|jgi:lipopolysaccharide assembly protein B|uniref:Lipopolysaccharide assembly protein B n=1 Tax=Alteromonas mediterranea TaxID=314275 RepID=A0AAC9JEN7_9ALTE|nr:MULTISPECIES: lipopolysaccharide assembly protein LapB [Alteromonas]MBR9898304.1 lipopolysaccharide assembly protein LapB [Gammaproteobacteria bacterium]MEA3380232.1 lipopolysaccharide assembly protein LapB [Pseudomonadota bacterium]APD90067.1 lipopolysaccharide assembly protein LapB [Alteromonas mediterranea]APE02130.1 lipopolysaccharide assembly protein LapB [Alteromonas mediterranea]NQY19256.1 lipopolysaccharide assembly protein LapB [Alteromonas sp.]